MFHVQYRCGFSVSLVVTANSQRAAAFVLKGSRRSQIKRLTIDLQDLSLREAVTSPPAHHVRVCVAVGLYNCRVAGAPVSSLARSNLQGCEPPDGSARSRPFLDFRRYAPAVSLLSLAA
ncbi:hypothetical protein SKAU_G00257980 [Synaphobranchus kaupii]|uniref:Uncharacterized protein n=1 Tax=Synaphobranchus kaupii TaxID=118154 RepID=A0A9Q1F446_SYNKA|nr:hypothetical protein SKAU_G00257980 [Synaphobranchus kaupii]